MKNLFHTTIVGLATMVLAVTATLFSLPFIQEYVTNNFPAKTEWKVTQAQIDGRDLVMMGTFIKHYNCEYIKPPGATNALTGEPLFVESASASGDITYPARPEPYVWGPWRVVGGAGHVVDLFQRDKCFPMWVTITRLGTYDAIKMVQVR